MGLWSRCRYKFKNSVENLFERTKGMGNVRHYFTFYAKSPKEITDALELVAEKVKQDWRGFDSNPEEAHEIGKRKLLFAPHRNPEAPIYLLDARDHVFSLRLVFASVGWKFQHNARWSAEAIAKAIESEGEKSGYPSYLVGDIVGRRVAKDTYSYKNTSKSLILGGLRGMYIHQDSGNHVRMF